MDHGTLVAVGGFVLNKIGSSLAGESVKRLLGSVGAGRASAIVDRVYQQQVEEIALEWPANYAALEARIADQGRDLRAEIASKLDERSGTIWFYRMLDEAIESPTHERLQLMCAGMAGVFNPDLDVEVKSRVVRAVGMLEPSDVRVLRRLVEEREVHDIATPLNWQALRQANCVAVSTQLRENPFGTRSQAGGWQGGGPPPVSLPELHESWGVTYVGGAVVAFLATSAVKNPRPKPEPSRK